MRKGIGLDHFYRDKPSPILSLPNKVKMGWAHTEPSVWDLIQDLSLKQPGKNWNVISIYRSTTPLHSIFFLMLLAFYTQYCNDFLEQIILSLSLSQMAASYEINPSLIMAMDLLHVIFPCKSYFLLLHIWYTIVFLVNLSFSYKLFFFLIENFNLGFYSFLIAFDIIRGLIFSFSS